MIYYYLLFYRAILCAILICICNPCKISNGSLFRYFLYNVSFYLFQIEYNNANVINYNVIINNVIYIYLICFNNLYM
jgi:hypothetical protein